MHGTIRREHATQRAEPCIGVRQVMEDSGAHDLIEGHLQFLYPLDGKLVDLEIVQAVFPLECQGMAHAGGAKVDAGNVGRRPAQGMLGRLRCAAAGDQDGSIFPERPGGPVEVIIGAAPVLILPETAIFIEALERLWIRITVVKVSNLLGYRYESGWVFSSLAHRKVVQDGYVCWGNQHTYPIRSVHAAVRSLVHSRDHLIDVEGGRFLARRELFE
jgi:hypothetical protein